MSVVLDVASAFRVEVAGDVIFAALDSQQVPVDVAARYLESLYSRADEVQALYLTPSSGSVAMDKAGLFDDFLSSSVAGDALDLRLRSLRRLAKRDPPRARKLLQPLLNTGFPADSDCGATVMAYPGVRY